MDLSNLPRNEKTGNIDWKKSVGYRCSFIYGKITGEIEIIDYIKHPKNSRLLLKYNERVKEVPVNTLKLGTIGDVIGVFTSDFYYEIGEIVKVKNQKIEIIDRYYKKEQGRNRKYYHIKCMDCGCINESREATVKKLKGCPVCAGRVVVKGINDIATVAPWMVDYFPDGIAQAEKYTAQSEKKFTFICPCCGKESKKISICHLYNNHSCGCQCKKVISFPEMVIYNLLEFYNVEFIHCATKNNCLPWAKSYRYDFYLNERNCIIEAHGGQHYSSHGFSSVGGKTLEEEQLNDLTKKNLAKENGVDKYFEIDCRKSNVNYIVESCKKSGMLSYLNIDITQINENDLLKDYFKSKINEYDILLEERPDISKKELCKELHISMYILKKILRIKNNETNIERSNSSCGRKKKINVYYDNELIAHFDSIAECERKSKESIGIHMDARHMFLYLDKPRLLKKHYSFTSDDDDLGVVAC